jgi:GTP-binding protein
VSYQVILTKADKPNARDIERVVAATYATIAKRPAAHPEIIVTSSETRFGIPELRAEIAALVEN